VIEILAISGSLRQASINTKLLTAIARAAPDDMTINLFSGLGALPFFNPDLEGFEPDSVLAFRRALSTSDGVIISSPEYAHGITGVMKNALDWIVGSGEFMDKPVAVLNAAPRSSTAYETLKEVVHTIDAKIISDASIDIPVLGRDLDVGGLLSDPEIAPLIGQVISSLMTAINTAADYTT
jgi:chromate reductase, NAD(P)H dehydrogenase (quinone)